MFTDDDCRSPLLLRFSTPVATAHAAVDTIGSDLSGTATTAIQHAEDTALVQLSGAAGPAVPTGGQVLSTHVKGCSEKGNVPQNPETALYIQDLRGSGASQRVISTSQQFHLPICGAGPTQNTVTSLRGPGTSASRPATSSGSSSAARPPATRRAPSTSSPRPIPARASGCSPGTATRSPARTTRSRPRPTPSSSPQTRVGTGADSPSRCAGGSGGGGGGGGKRRRHPASSCPAR